MNLPRRIELRSNINVRRLFSIIFEYSNFQTYSIWILCYLESEQMLICGRGLYMHICIVCILLHILNKYVTYSAVRTFISMGILQIPE